MRSGIGGPAGYETDDGFEKEMVKRCCEDFSKRIEEYKTLLTESRIGVAATKGVGTLNAADAIALGVSGPCCARARASNGIFASGAVRASPDRINLKFRGQNR